MHQPVRDKYLACQNRQRQFFACYLATIWNGTIVHGVKTSPWTNAPALRLLIRSCYSTWLKVWPITFQKCSCRRELVGITFSWFRHNSLSALPSLWYEYEQSNFHIWLLSHPNLWPADISVYTGFHRFVLFLFPTLPGAPRAARKIIYEWDLGKKLVGEPFNFKRNVFKSGT